MSRGRFLKGMIQQEVEMEMDGCDRDLPFAKAKDARAVSLIEDHTADRCLSKRDAGKMYF